MKKNVKIKRQRFFKEAKSRDSKLRALKLLPGDWKGTGSGWNMIALPFHGAPNNFRVLMNQYDEQLSFSFVDGNVPNRGLGKNLAASPLVPDKFDQRVVTIDYQQTIQQTAAEDFPESGLAGGSGLAIHHEPGLWLYMKNKKTNGLNIARLACVPHGNSVLALGKSKVVRGKVAIPPVNGLPIGRFNDLDASTPDKYLSPYQHYLDKPFFGNKPESGGFPGFSPKNMNAILEHENIGLNVKKTTILSVDTEVEDGAISNIPFIVKQAEAVSMKSTFWIQELHEKDPNGKPKLRMQYSQIVMLDFFTPRQDELPGRASWPHISINTLEKVY